MFNRSTKRLMRAVFEPNHWISLVKSFLVCEKPFEYLRRYIFAGGAYPWRMVIRTPTGRQTLVLNRFEDIFTINEIFIWEVYRVSDCARVFLDIGGNVGFASLYFLTRCNDSRGVLVEPLLPNIIRAKELLSCFSDRIEFINSAVSFEDGSLEIGVEPTGRYSGVDCLETGTRQTFVAIGINVLLARVSGSLGNIDIVKIDCEGAERQFMPTITGKSLERVSRFRIESQAFDDSNLIAADFTRSITFDDGLGGYVYDFHRIL
jgi:FkbM family methyltransferase